MNVIGEDFDADIILMTFSAAVLGVYKVWKIASIALFLFNPFVASAPFLYSLSRERMVEKGCIGNLSIKQSWIQDTYQHLRWESLWQKLLLQRALS